MKKQGAGCRPPVVLSQVLRFCGFWYVSFWIVSVPFFLSYAIFSLIPLADTIRNSFYEYYAFGLKTVGPNWTGLSNYTSLLSSDLPKYAWNTFVMWILGFVPQIIVALVLASWFTDARLKIRGKQFFKVVIYLPNLIMASAFAMLFFALFSNAGPVNSILLRMGVVGEAIRFMESTLGARTLVGLMNFLMWFGNTTIMLMAAIMGINPSIFEAAELDGCTHIQKFFKITLPQIKPLLTYTLITSLIGGLQMFDVPQILTGGKGAPDRTTMTLIMYLNKHLQAKNYGIAGALSVFLFIISAILCWFVFKMNTDSDPDGSKSAAKRAKKGGKA